ncbi:hypothetical protein GIB67_008932 [Kingdonia uniflora]|uniref:Uncharacterized protein n=1 Tax=Kingdonia uniflora TaxID=39325 RepID=A0A7J7LVH9_9MAGN|nr:hypothetical protein GIB67_008932 [Kingdonia uniflora]
MSTSTFLSLVATVSTGTTSFGLPVVILFVDVSRVCNFSIACVLSVTVGATVVYGYDNPVPNIFFLVRERLDVVSNNTQLRQQYKQYIGSLS